MPRYLLRRRARSRYARRTTGFRRFRARRRKMYRRKYRGRKAVKFGNQFIRRAKYAVRRPLAFPNIKKVKLDYVTYFDLQVGAGGSTAYRHFGVNNLQDPDVTGVGHNPYGYDELATIWQSWCVIAHKTTCTFVNTTIDGTTIAQVGMYQRARLTGSFQTPKTTCNTIIESNFGPTAILTGADRPPNSRKQLSLGANTCKLVGAHPLQDVTNWTNFGVNRADSDSVDLVVWAGAQDGAQPRVRVFCKIEFIALVRNPKNFNESG